MEKETAGMVVLGEGTEESSKMKFMCQPKCTLRNKNLGDADVGLSKHKRQFNLSGKNTQGWSWLSESYVFKLLLS